VDETINLALEIHRDLQSLSSVPLLGWKRNRGRT